jgi:hypothetical protein
MSGSCTLQSYLRKHISRRSEKDFHPDLIPITIDGQSAGPASKMRIRYWFRNPYEYPAMFSAISRIVNEQIYGKLVHSYDKIEVQHGNMICRDHFEIREKKGRRRLYNERSWQDKYDVKQFCGDYDCKEADALRSVFDKSIELISQGEVADFGIILRRQDRGMQSAERFYTQQSGGALYLFRREESAVIVAAIGEIESSEDISVTYYPIEEVAAIAGVLTDAQQRMSASR